MSKSFDRVADIYDDTRSMPPAATAGIIRNIRREIDPSGGLLLEIGVGTGRIAIPLAESGFRIVGVDVAEKMLTQLRKKGNQSAIRALFGDARTLPFAENSFHAVIAVHVFHLLLENLRDVIEEVRRVLSEGGSLLFGGEQRLLRYIQEMLRARYELDEDIVGAYAEAGIYLPDQPEVERKVFAIAESMGADVFALDSVTWNYEISVTDILNRIEGRTASYLWNVPDETLKDLVDKLRTKLVRQTGSLSATVPFERAFRMFRICFA